MDDNIEDSNLQRYSFTLPPNIVDKVNEFAERLKMNRSMVMREALTNWLASQSSISDISGKGVAVVSYIYNHHDTRVLSELLDIQHNFENIIGTSTHLHLSHTKCFEIVICKGEIGEIKQLSDKIRSIKGLTAFSEHIAID